jgi:exonuclease VII large subunit
MSTRVLAALAAAVLICLGVGVASAAADDPVATAQADLQTLVKDATTLHSTVLADAQKISSDVQALQGSTNRQTIRQTLQADVQKVQSDRQQLLPAVEADWNRLKSDLAAVKQAKAGKGQLKPLLQQAQQQLQQERDAVKAALQSAHQAAQALRQSLQGSGPGKGSGAGNGGSTNP